MGARSSHTSKTRSKSDRSNSLSDRMSRPRKLRISYSLLMSRGGSIDAGEEHADAFLVGDASSCAKREQPCEPRRAGRVDRDAGCLAAQLVGFGQGLLADDDRCAVRREHSFDDGEPVVGLVVEN